MYIRERNLVLYPQPTSMVMSRRQVHPKVWDLHSVRWDYWHRVCDTSVRWVTKVMSEDLRLGTRAAGQEGPGWRPNFSELAV